MKFKQLLVSMVLAAVVAGLNAKDVLDMELANEALGKGVKIAVWPEGKIPLSGHERGHRPPDGCDRAGTRLFSVRWRGREAGGSRLPGRRLYDSRLQP